jgi:hypothetical protein
MQTVITATQARQITGGRTPLMPFEYEEAMRQLDACISLDTAKYWSTASDALAAWAKMYHSKDADLKARQLKLRAYKEMGRLAEELRPTKHGGVSGQGRKGHKPGAHSLLLEEGMSTGKARDILAVSRLPNEKFSEAFKAGRGVHAVASENRGLGIRKQVRSDKFNWLVNAQSGPRLQTLRMHLRGVKAKEIANCIRTDESKVARALVVEIVEWLDEFERHLPKAAK